MVTQELEDDTGQRRGWDKKEQWERVILNQLELYFVDQNVRAVRREKFREYHLILNQGSTSETLNTENYLKLFCYSSQRQYKTSDTVHTEKLIHYIQWCLRALGLNSPLELKLRRAGMVGKIHKFLIGDPKYIENSKEHTQTKMLGSTKRKEITNMIF